MLMTFGFAPDGGAWYTQDPLEGGKLVAVFEAKKQGKVVVTHVNVGGRMLLSAKLLSTPMCSYVTFCAGEGAGEDVRCTC